MLITYYRSFPSFPSREKPNMASGGYINFFYIFWDIFFLEKDKSLYISQISLSCYNKIFLIYHNKIFLIINLVIYLDLIVNWVKKW